MEVILCMPSKINNSIFESTKARILAATYRSYFSKPRLSEKELEEAEKIRQEYMKETNYIVNNYPSEIAEKKE